jgi:hypothetical protein
MNDIALVLQLMAEKDPSRPLSASEGELLIAKRLFGYTKYRYPVELVRAILCADAQSVN